MMIGGVIVILSVRITVILVTIIKDPHRINSSSP